MNELHIEGIRTLAQHLVNCKHLTKDPKALKALQECIAELLARAAWLHAHPKPDDSHTFEIK